MCSYSSITVNDKNFIKSWLQRNRLKHSLLEFQENQILENFECKIIDWGGGWRTM